jgi:peptide chain release factor 1
VTVNLHDWIDELCDVLDVEVEVDEAVILDLARDSAHNVERRSAPITTFLLGYAAAGFEGAPQQVERLAGLATALALRWDKAPEEIKDEVEEVEVEIDDKDLKIDVYRSTGPGGQSVNTTDSAVRITHLPTGIVVSMQDEKSQLQNKQKALRVLRARLYEAERERQQAEVAAARRSQVGTGERAEKIRTYNFPENRLTDHRIKLTVHRLDQIVDGDLGEFTDALQAEERRRALEAAV